MSAPVLKETIVVNNNGSVTLPQWVWNGLLRQAGVRSKKYRIQKKVVKKEFTKLMSDYLKQVEANR